MKQKILSVFLSMLILISVTALVYPTLSKIVADYTSTKVIVDYDKQIQYLKEQLQKEKSKTSITDFLKNTDNTKIELKRQEAEEEVEEVSLRDLIDDIKDGQLIGYIECETIDLYLPIYEGTADSVLSKGVGHLKNTSYFDGLGSHTVLTGHSGRATATLFSKIENLKINDIFIVHFLDETYAYKVNQRIIIYPNQADEYLQKEGNRDYTTLITCYPQTINTHRLLVRGVRIDYNGADEQGTNSISKSLEAHQQNTTLHFALTIFLFLLLIILIKEIFKYIHKKDNKCFS